jgi:hypothetical protein
MSLVVLVDHTFEGIAFRVLIPVPDGDLDRARGRRTAATAARSEH